MLVVTLDHAMWVQKAAEYQVGGGNELNRITYISQVGLGALSGGGGAGWWTAS